MCQDIDNSRLFLYSRAYSFSPQDSHPVSCGMNYYFKPFWFCHLSPIYLHSTDVCERTREELGNLSSFTSSATLLFAASKFWQRTDSFELQYYLGRPCALLTLIRTRISNAILHFLTLRHLGMLGLDQQWQGSSWWSSRLLEKWWSRGIVLKTVLRHRLEQVDTVWIFYAFTSIDGYCLSESAKLAFLQEIFVRGHCPWPNHLEGTVSWWEGSLFPFFPFSFSMIFIFFPSSS